MNDQEQLIKRFHSKINSISPQVLNKNFFYLNIWSLGCIPCIDEMVFLETLPDFIKKDIAYIYVSMHSNEAVNSFLNKKSLKSNNFIFVNDLKDFALHVFDQIYMKGICFPTHIIMEKKGKILAYLSGSVFSEQQASPLISFINNLE